MIGTFWKRTLTGRITVILRSDPLNWVVLHGTEVGASRTEARFP